MKNRALLLIFASLACVVSGNAAPTPTPVATPTPTPTLAPGATPVPPPTPTPAPPMMAEKYRDALSKSEAALRALERNAAKNTTKLRRTFPPPATVKRSDGDSQSADNADLGRAFSGYGTRSAPANTLTKKEVRDVRESVRRRRVALDEWAQPRDGIFFQPADAKKLVAQLEASGEIRTGPTQFQLWWAGIRKGVSDFLEKISKWIFGSTPKSPVKVPRVDERWITFFFYSTVLSLLAVIAYFVWKNLGGKWGRGGAAREVRYLEGEDAALLRLPPDELRDRARRFAQDGNFREALRHLYISLLVNLDARGVWRYDTRRTNWEHISALRGEIARASLVAPMSELTRRFDRVRYGNARADENDWLLFQSDVEALENSLDKSTPDSKAKSAVKR